MQPQLAFHVGGSLITNGLDRRAWDQTWVSCDSRNLSELGSEHIYIYHLMAQQLEFKVFWQYPGFGTHNP